MRKKDLFYLMLLILCAVLLSCKDDSVTNPNNTTPTPQILFVLDSICVTPQSNGQWVLRDTAYYSSDTTWTKVNIKFQFITDLDPNHGNDEARLRFSPFYFTAFPYYATFNYDSTWLRSSLSGPPYNIGAGFELGIKSNAPNTQSKAYLKNVRIIKIN